VHNKVTEKLVLITGKTYPVRAELKALGGAWDAGAKGWRVPEARADAARDLVAHGASRRPRDGSADTRFSKILDFIHG